MKRRKSLAFSISGSKGWSGVFLLVYLVLIVTVGFALLTTDIAIGRRTGKSAIRAYESMKLFR